MAYKTKLQKINEFKSIMRERRIFRENEKAKRLNPDNINTVADVMYLNNEKGYFFFSPDTLKFFNSQIYGGELLGNNKDLFITSEKQPKSLDGSVYPRKFTIRKVNKSVGDIDTIAGFGAFSSKIQAENYIKQNNL